MNNAILTAKIRNYYLTAVASLLFAVIGFSYNAWRLERSEDNSTVRVASFEVLKELAELERIIYLAHYDQNTIEGSPRKAWVKVGLITDLSVLISEDVTIKTGSLKKQWSENWNKVAQDSAATNSMVKAIDDVRQEIKAVLTRLD